MNVKTFLQHLKAQPQKTLHFVSEQRFEVEAFIHLTEIKTLQIESVDCGGSKNSWTDTVMQLWTGAKEDDGHRLDSSQMLAIFEKVNQLSTLENNSELILEYGNAEFFVSNYSIDLLKTTQNALYFSLIAQLSQCKGLEGSASQACCSGADTNQATSCCA